MFLLRVAFLIPLVLMAPANSIGQETDYREFFETRIRPVLVKNCFSCHTNSQLGGLQLDTREHLLKGGQSGPAIVPGKPEESLLIRAISHADERLKMPMGGKLTDQEIADLKTWVKMGAPWPAGENLVPAVAKNGEYVITPEQRAFWSFQPCQEPSLPQVKDKTWPKSSIDPFILSQLEAQGLTPVKAADKRVLIRRTSFDLTGLPPTPEEVEAFLRDKSPQAFARVVDRLLASPRYGERWGRYWLDVARFADDDARGADRESYPNAFRYRDWVIQAFNSDMPYNLFVKAQIAGDLLDVKDSEKLIPGLGFFGLGPWYYDMVEPLQGRADERHDRVDALTRSFLGLTVACARCHDHKYDPISMKDYYALAGVFASSEYREYPLVPKSVVAGYDEQQRKIKNLEAEIKDFLKTQGNQLGEIFARKTSQYLMTTWKVMKEPTAELEKIAAEEKLDPELLERWVKYIKTPEKGHPYLKAWNDLLIRGGPFDEAREVSDEFQALVLSVLGEKKAVDEENRIILEQAKSKKTIIARLPNGYVVYDEHCPGCNTSMKSIEKEKYILWMDLLGEKRKRPDLTWTDSGVLLYEDEKLDRFLGSEWKSHLEAMRAELDALKKALPPQYPYLHAMGESSSPANLKIHLRGSPYNLGEEVPRRFLAILSNQSRDRRGGVISQAPPPFLKGSGRLELAETIASHPLTARVMVNRIWKHHFGRGIVNTPSNFGQLGERPTHPELLEYLASQFMKSNWSIKALHRDIMLSATYQLGSDSLEKNFAQDPDNRLYWHANRRRLDVEALRDSLLFVTGSLDRTMGGPSWELDIDNNKKRTVYGTISRFKLNSTLALFDFPTPSISSEQRNVTHVPLQRLFFLNSDLIMTQAQALANHLLEDARTDDAARIKTLYPLFFGREVRETELRLGLDFLKASQTESAGSTLAWQQYIQALLSSNEFSFVD